MYKIDVLCMTDKYSINVEVELSQNTFDRFNTPALNMISNVSPLWVFRRMWLQNCNRCLMQRYGFVKFGLLLCSSSQIFGNFRKYTQALNLNFGLALTKILLSLYNARNFDRRGPYIISEKHYCV